MDQCAKKILLIDDEESVGVALKRILPQHEVRQELSGAAGLAVAYFWRPDLLLLDLRLPDVHGEDLAAMIRGDRFLGRTPIIFLTATRAWMEQDQPQTLHGWPVFGKPFNVGVLRWYVESALQMARGLAEHSDLRD
jgi:DNA-binding response OmpR family regulator